MQRTRTFRGILLLCVAGLISGAIRDLQADGRNAASPPPMAVPAIPGESVATRSGEPGPTVSSRGLGTNAVRLRRSGSDRGVNPSTWPATAPTTYAAANRLKFPDGEKLFGLDFGGNAGREGHYEGPDGGRVYQWGGSVAGLYRWDRQDGIIFTRWPDGGWCIDVGGHKIFRHGKNAGVAAGWVAWNFPDGVELRRSPAQDGSRNWEYYYTHWNGADLTSFQMYRSPAARYRTAQVGPYQFTYDSTWQSHIDRLAATRDDAKFFEFVEQSLSLRNVGPIPVVMFLNLDEFRGQTGDLKRGPGGVGGMYGISMCCGKDRAVKSKNETIRAAQAHAESYHVLYHETMHSLTQKRCYYARAEGKTPADKGAAHPGHWFVEGVADFAVMQWEPRARVWMYRAFFERIDRGAPPAFTAVDYTEERAYIFGRLMVEYLFETKGFESIREYYDATCRGETSEQAMQAAVGRTPEQVYRESIEYFRNRREQIEAQYFAWEIDGLYAVEFENPDASREGASLAERTRNPANAKDLFAIKAVPDIFNAYRLKLGALRGPEFEGFVRTSDDHKVFIWRGGEVYSVESPEYKTYVRDAEVSMEFNGHRIHNWANGQRRWVLPDGRYFHMWSPDQPAGYFDAQGRPLSAP